MFSTVLCNCDGMRVNRCMIDTEANGTFSFLEILMSPSRQHLHPGSQWIFLQDNARSHSARAAAA